MNKPFYQCAVCLQGFHTIEDLHRHEQEFHNPQEDREVSLQSAGGPFPCPECGHEWNPEEITAAVEAEKDSSVVKDANGNVLQDGDTVIIIKDLPVKGSSKPIKGGTKVKNIKLTSGDHNIDAKVDGFGAMGLKSIYVKKA